MFKKAEGKAAGDARGTVRVKVILQDPNLQPGFPVPGNATYVVSVDGATVGEVKAAIEAALFGKMQTST